MVIAAVERSWAGVPRLRSPSPRRILTCLLCESAKVTTSAISAFSAAGCCPTLSRAGEPRTILTALHSVSGKVTSCTLPVLLSIACLTVSTEICGLAFKAASAVHADHSAVPAQKNTPAEIPPRIAPSIGAGDQNHPQRRDILTDTPRISEGKFQRAPPPNALSSNRAIN